MRFRRGRRSFGRRRGRSFGRRGRGRAQMTIAYSPKRFLGITNPRQATQSKQDTTTNPTEGVYATYQIFPTKAGQAVIGTTGHQKAMKYRLVMAVDYSVGFFERRALGNEPVPGNAGHHTDL